MMESIVINSEPPAVQALGHGAIQRISMKKLTLLLGLGLAACIAPLHAAVRLPAIFGDNMVLQRGDTTPMWGHADPGEHVTVAVGGQSVSTTADAQGRWRVVLPKLDAADPLEVTVKGKNTLTLKNVLVGDVWLGSGQSNMDWRLRSYEGKVEAAAAKYPRIRLFKTPTVVATTPQDDVSGKWTECTPETAGDFSAVLYFMGRDLHKQLGVPVGLIESAWGGTVIQAWSRYDSLITDPEAAKVAKAQLAQIDDPAWCERDFQSKLARFAKQQAELKDKPDALKALRPPEKQTPFWNNRPGGLYNAMIAPLAGYGLRGVAWYQGEFNNGQGELYGRLLPKMIADWRAAWGQGDFPFLVVQLPHIGTAPQTEPTEVGKQWAYLREAQLKALALPHTAVVVTVDLGDGSLHPRNKEPFAQRLVLAALKVAYGKDLPASGPLYQDMAVEGDAIRIRFTHTDGGLVALDNAALQGFVIAGDDRNFVWAAAQIDGDSAVVRSEHVSRPVAVRYAWADYPRWSLFNKAGLPASPFRTDAWPLSAPTPAKKP